MIERTLTVDHTPDPSDYSASRKALLWRRTRVCILFALLLIPIFGILDLLVTPGLFRFLLPLRLAAELGFLLLLVLISTRLGSRYPESLLTVYYLLGGWLMAHLSVLTGGFESFHAKSLIFLLVGVSVLVPVKASVHALGQFLALSYYVIINTTGASLALQAILQNSYLLWLCVLCDVAVYMYDRLQHAEFSARQELETSNRKLLELDRMKNEFFGNVSHELRTPLTLIIGSYRTLQKLALPIDLRATLDAGLRNSARLLVLINNLLDLARSDSGRLPMRKQCTDLSALVRLACANFASSGSGRQIHLELEDRVLAEVDARHMKQVMYNLLSNAWKFTDPEHGEVWVRLRAQEGKTELQVQDNGIGIPGEHLDRIFDRFYQVEGSATRQYAGTGIGLALVKDSLERHGGTISVQSEVDRGSCFTVTIPQGHVVATPANLVEEEPVDACLQHAPIPDTIEPEHIRSSQASCTEDAPLILIADDDVDLCRYLEHILTPHFRIAVAHDGTEALAMTRALKPDLIVTDIMMPRMSGYDFLRAVRSDSEIRTTPIIVLTAKAGGEALVESLDVGADDYLAKPFEEGELLARVRTHLRVRAQERELQLTNQKLQEVDQLKSAFVSVVSHELRTPMTALKGYLDNLLSGLTGPLTDKQRQYLGRMQANIERLTRIVNELLDLARIESGHVEMDMTYISAAEIVRDTVELFQPVAQAKGVTLNGQVQGEPPRIHADRDKLQQIFTNLIQNAIKFTPEGGAVRLTAQGTGNGMAEFCVTDTGCGISSEELPKVFERFYRGDAVHTEQRGAGLGLAITKSLIELHGGKIWVESSVGHGSQFYCSLPMVQEATQTMVGEEHK